MNETKKRILTLTINGSINENGDLVISREDNIDCERCYALAFLSAASCFIDQEVEKLKEKKPCMQ